MKNSDVSSEDEASDMSASSTDLPEHCVQLTRDQYQSLCQCHTHPLFKKAVLPLSHPSWEELMAASQPIDHCLSWWIHRYWLGSLKYALLSKEVEGGEELYSKIFAIYEELVADFDETAFFPPNTRWLVFNHIGRGVFQLRLSAAQEGRKRVFKSKLASLPTEEECKREIRVLAAEAMHVSRGSAWPKYGKNFYEHVASLPLAILEEEDSDVDFSPEGLDDATIGPDSAAFRHELRRTVAYVAEKMESRGDSVDWDYLHIGAMTDSQNSTHNLLSTLSKSLDDFVEDQLSST